MLRRLTNSGLNLAVLVAAVAVFLGAFLALNSLAAAQKPPSITVLASNRDLNIGEVINAGDLVERMIYVDENASIYIESEEAGEVIGGVVALPIYAGQPLIRSAVIAPVGEESRLSAVLAQYPNHSLFPLPLEANNVIAPQAGSFMPGDLVGVTVVIGTRPQPPTTPTPPINVFTIPGSVIQGLPTGFPKATDLVITSTLEVPALDMDSGEEQALARAAPPLAKDIFPQGALVIAVQGLPQLPRAARAEDSTESPQVFTGLPEKRLLVLLIPNKSREHLALAMQRADRVFVSLLTRGDAAAVTPGFTYWDFEDLFEADRKEALEADGNSEPINAPTAPTATALP